MDCEQLTLTAFLGKKKTDNSSLDAYYLPASSPAGSAMLSPVESPFLLV